ncbi:hypothetical protein EHP00_1072 [Ecytonucleospora hepatopenaei]|uniref:Uncharacterized protein n=1 Tax=Ecytonucleospora hepatopenaei TaxID=646526 RepID=A0A1W0E557_9MICR|nr:hypothetical protein EHP00_1072 [Ecytonucleospora hepatopenaei]
MLFFAILNSIYSASSTNEPFLNRCEGMVENFLSKMPMHFLEENKMKALDFCRRNNLRNYTRSIKIKDGIIFHYSLVDNDCDVLLGLAEFIKNNFKHKHSMLTSVSVQNFSISKKLKEIFGEGELPENFNNAIRKYNKWLIKNGLGDFKVTATTFRELTEVKFDADVYDGPGNVFIDFLLLKEDLAYYYQRLNESQRRLILLRNLRKFRKNFGYFYGCFVIMKKYLYNHTEPCIKFPFDYFRSKCEECLCYSCKKYVYLNIYLARLKGIFNIAKATMPYHDHCNEIIGHYEDIEHDLIQIQIIVDKLRNIAINLD